MLLPSGSSCQPRLSPEHLSQRAGRPPEYLAGSTCSKWMEDGSSAPAPPGSLLPIHDPSLTCPGTSPSVPFASSPSTPSSPHPSVYDPQALSAPPPLPLKSCFSPPLLLLGQGPTVPYLGHSTLLTGLPSLHSMHPPLQPEPSS